MLATGAPGAAGADVDVGLDGLPLEAEDELPALEPEFELLTLLTALPAENGFADPEPHPTIEATAIAAALNLIKTLEENCT
ncbi:MAG TPA: hypothetical protein VNX88_19785 [Terriglobales bacterium]|nr:hypothetical protein [Terriglobales bacterium]